MNRHVPAERLSPTPPTIAIPHQISVGDRIPELDGARGLAVLSVVISHYFGENDGPLDVWLGWMGVTLFFVLSGFLIGSIILERKDSPNFLSVFYIRRALRILPIYFLTITATLTFIWLYGPSNWIDVPFSAAFYFTFTQNFVMAWHNTVGTPWLGPTWTLTVEEQFYLIFPLVVLLVPVRALVHGIVAGVALCLLTRYLLYTNGAIAGSKWLLFSNGQILLAGVLAAYIRHQKIAMPRMALVLSPFIAIDLALAALTVTKSELFVYIFLATVPLLFAAYILLAAQGWIGLRFLRSKILRAFGTISYCLYLIHQPVSGVMHGLILDARPDFSTTPQLLVTCAALIVSISIAIVSWFALERPLLRMGRRISWSDMHLTPEPTSIDVRLKRSSPSQ